MIDFSAYIQSEWSWIVLFVMAVFVGMSKTGVQGLAQHQPDHAGHRCLRHSLCPGRCLPGDSHREIPAREGIPDIHYRCNDYQHPRDAACLTMKIELNLRALKLAGERIRSPRNGIDFEEYSDWHHFFLPKI